MVHTPEHVITDTNRFTVEEAHTWISNRFDLYEAHRGEKVAAVILYAPDWDEVTGFSAFRNVTIPGLLAQMVQDAGGVVQGSEETWRIGPRDPRDFYGFELTCPLDYGRIATIHGVPMTAGQVRLFEAAGGLGAFMPGRTLEILHTSQPHEHNAYLAAIRFASQHGIYDGLRDIADTIAKHWATLPTDALTAYNALLPNWAGELEELAFHSQVIAGRPPVKALR